MRHHNTHTPIYIYVCVCVCVCVVCVCVCMYVYRRVYKCRSQYLQTRRDSSETVRKGKCEWVSLGSVVIRLWVGQPINFQGRDFYSFPKRPDRV